MSKKQEYLCEVCGKNEQLTVADAFSTGWDYPPSFGAWGVISPRTCGDCTIVDTAWWALQTGAELTERHLETIKRILGESK